MDDYSREMGHINDEWYKNLGYGDILFDPMQLTDIGKQDFYPEGRDMFLSRTLLTGSEIAEMTNSLLSNYASVSISTDLPT